MKLYLSMMTAAWAADYDAEWSEFQAVQGTRDGPIPQAFKDSVDFVRSENAKQSDYILSYTGPHADKSEEEYTQLLGFKQQRTDMPHVGMHVNSGLPAVDSLDWSAQGAVTPIKDQGQCGSCWAFSTTGSTEGQWQLATGNLLSLSEQQLVDCSKVNEGCQGGFMDDAFKFYATTDIASEDSYPYTGQNGNCKGSPGTAIPKGGVTGLKDVANEEDLLDAVTNVGPISVAIEADQRSFQNYKSGVLTASCGTHLDHGVLAVGFGEDGGKKYWKVKNSWGVSYGEDGYVRIQRGVNKCGIGQQPSYPVVDGAPSPPTPPMPAPIPEPTPAPTPAPPGQHHYGAPPCLDDETDVDVGSFVGPDRYACAATCAETADCPTDADVKKAKPTCFVGGYCALRCGLFSGDCPKGTKCAGIGAVSPGVGICSHEVSATAMEV